MTADAKFGLFFYFLNFFYQNMFGRGSGSSGAAAAAETDVEGFIMKTL